jgi:hypothetical protein
MTCGECGGFVSATSKEKILRSTGDLKRYTLYYCVCARKSPDGCTQSFYTNVNTIEEEIERRLSGITIMPEFKNWALRVLAETHGADLEVEANVAETRENAVREAKKQLANLMDLRLQDLIDDDDFKQKHAELKTTIVRCEVQAAEAQETRSKYVKITEEAFEFAFSAHKSFLLGDAETRREIFSTFSLNQRLFDGLFSFEAVEWLTPIENEYPALEAKIKAFEPALYGTDEWEKTAFAVFNPEVRGRRDLNPRSPP